MKKLKVMMMTLMMCLVGISFYSCEKNDINDISKNYVYGTVTDIDGNVYKTVTIGTQTWMTENLRVTKYNDGTAIPNVMVDSIWAYNKNYYGSHFYPMLCYYENDSSNNKIYGVLYNHYVTEGNVVTGVNIAPKGWRVPYDEDWEILTKYLKNNPSAKNIKDFTNGSHGFRDSGNGSFSNDGANGWWSIGYSTQHGWPMANVWVVNTSYCMNAFKTDRKNGLAIRCIKNN